MAFYRAPLSHMRTTSASILRQRMLPPQSLAKALINISMAVVGGGARRHRRDCFPHGELVLRFVDDARSSRAEEETSLPPPTSASDAARTE